MFKMMRKAQSFFDYSMLMIVIAISLAAMSSYIYQSITARVHHLKRDLTDPVNGVR